MEDNVYRSSPKDAQDSAENSLGGSGHGRSAPHKLEIEMYDLMRTSQLRLLLLHTGFIVLLLRKIITSPDWELWVTPLLLLAEAALWLMRLREMFSMRARNYIIIIYSLISIFFYGIHTDSFGNVPLLLSLFVVAYSTVGDFFTINCSVICYAALLIYHVTVTGAFQQAWAADANRTSIQLVTVLFVIPMFARSFISDRSDAANLREANIKRMREENASRDDFFAGLIRGLKTMSDDILRRSKDLCAILDNEQREEVQSGTGRVPRTSRISGREGTSALLAPAAAELRSAGKRLADRVNSMMIYSDVLTGNIRPLEERWRISDLADRITSFTEELHAEKESIDIVYDFSPDMPSELIGDIDRLSEAAMCLIDNAIKFTDSGGICISVFTRREPYGVNVCIEVNDTGCGMNTDGRSIIRHTDQAHLNNRTSDVRPASRVSRRPASLVFRRPSLRVSQRGLGLPIARGLARALNGFVTIHSAPSSAGDTQRGDELPDTQSRISMRENFVRIGTSVMLCVPQRISDQERWIRSIEDKKTEILIFIRNKEPRNDGMAQRRAHSAVREFRSRMISSVVNSLGVSVNVSSNIEEARAFIAKRGITHLIISEEDFIHAHGGCNICRRLLDAEKTATRDGSLGHCTNESGIFDRRYIGECLFGKSADRIKIGVFPASNNGRASGPAAGKISQLEGCRGVFTMRSPFSVVSIAEFLMLSEQATPPQHDSNGSGGLAAQSASIDKDEKPAAAGGLTQDIRADIPHSAEEQSTDDVPSLSDSAAPSAPLHGVPGVPLIERLRESGVNVDSALEYCGGMEEMYLDMVQDFSGMMTEKAEELNERIAADDADGYRIKVHSLKSNLRTLGFDEQADTAFELETLCKEGRWETAREQHHKMTEALKALDRMLNGPY